MDAKERDAEMVRLCRLAVAIQSSVDHAKRSLAAFQGHLAEAVDKLTRYAEFQPGNLVWVVDRLTNTAALAQVEDVKPVLKTNAGVRPFVYFEYYVVKEHAKASADLAGVQATGGWFTTDDLYAYKPGRTA